MQALRRLLQFPRNQSGELFLRYVIALAMLTCGVDAAYAADDRDELPSAALLEFLGELPPLDDETWEMLEHHADKDIAENEEVNSE